MLAFLPLVVGRINSKTYTENEPWLSANAVESDFFLYGKLFVLFFCCLFMIVILARMRFWRQIHEIPKYFLFLLGYGFLAIVSSLRAEHPFLSIRGMTGNMQGLFVILSYLVVFFYSFFWVKKTGNISILIKILGASIGILGVIGISQFFGFDLLSMGFVKEFLGGRKARVSHFIYLTLYHWNYVGSYVALLLPVTVAMIVYFHEEGKKRERTFWFALFYLLIFCLFGSQSADRHACGTGFVLCWRRKISEQSLSVQKDNSMRLCFCACNFIFLQLVHHREYFWKMAAGSLFYQRK